MQNNLKIALIKEGKTPPDSRVVLTPKQCRSIIDDHQRINIVAERSESRCYADEEYENEGIELVNDTADCDILLGVKEVVKDHLINDKTFFFFSHTIKKQSYNRALLQKIVEKNIRLIDYEVLKKDGFRVIAFGRWAGIVGAHNGLWTYAQKFNQFEIPRAKDLKDYEELQSIYKKIEFPPVKIVITGSGRVSRGAIEIMDHANIRKVNVEDFINKTFDEPVFVQLDCEHLYQRKSDNGFELQEFFKQPEIYDCNIKDILSKTDLFINAIYWDPKAPPYFSLEDMSSPDFNIKVIADITCDIAPVASIPSTIKATTITEPVYGFDKNTLEETAPFQKDTVDVMSIDNLPNELPRDASQAFGEMFTEHVIPEILKEEQSEMLYNATIARNNDLNKPFEYLRDYLEG